MRVLFYILFLFVSFPIIGQVTLERQVISPYGNYGTGSISISSTVGQPEYQTAPSANLILTQGFQQPESLNMNLSVFWELLYPLCDNGIGAELNILQITGCTGDEYEIIWDGQVSEAIITNIKAGTYTLSITSEGGCSYISEVVVPSTSLLPCDLDFPNGITPNSDAYNDNWEIVNIELEAYSTNKVSILNRWGSVVWEGENYDNETVVWNGTNTLGADLPYGTYYYVVTIQDLVFTGYIELMR